MTDKKLLGHKTHSDLFDSIVENSKCRSAVYLDRFFQWKPRFPVGVLDGLQSTYSNVTPTSYEMAINKCPDCPSSVGRPIPWIEVKASGLPGAGFGLFALTDFRPGDTISVYLGKRNKTKDNCTQKYRLLERDAQGGIGSGFSQWLGAHFANDPTLMESRQHRVNAQFGNDYLLTAKRRIHIGSEIVVDYQWNK